jgi:hypothetical protein
MNYKGRYLSSRYELKRKRRKERERSIEKWK